MCFPFAGIAIFVVVVVFLNAFKHLIIIVGNLNHSTKAHTAKVTKSEAYISHNKSASATILSVYIIILA